MAGEITQLKAGAIPGPWLAIGDKTEYTDPIDRGSARISALHVSVLPGRWRDVSVPAKIPAGEVAGYRDDTPITMLRSSVQPSAIYTITDKTPSESEELLISDTYNVFMRFGSFSDIVVELTDTYLPVLTLGTNVTQVKPVTDTYVPKLTLGAVVSGTSVATPVFATDVYVPVMTFAASVPVSGDLIESSDTYVPVLTFGAAVEATDMVEVSDTYVPVLYFSYIVTPWTFSTLYTVDTYVPRMTFGVTTSAAVRDVDRITGDLRPTGIITGRWT